MKKILLVLLLNAVFLFGCSARNTDNTQTFETKQIEKKDVSGTYLDKQGTSDIYSELTLTLQADGTYAAKIGIHRIGETTGIAKWDGDVLRYSAKDPYPSVMADISVIDNKAKVKFTTDGAGFHIGETYSFPDSAAAAELPQSNFLDEINAKISYTEKQEKKVEIKQEQAETQADMNQTANEMYELWDDTLNAVWKILEANLNKTDMETLRKEERKWVKFKEEEMKAAGEENEGGSMQPLLEAMKGAELTKARVYELAKYAKAD